MKFGVRLPVSGPFASADAIIETALTAERLGFDFVTAHDHIERGFHERYHFSVGTVESVDASVEVTNFFESLATLSFLAGKTTKIKFIPAALVLPVRNVPTVIKQFQTAQLLSGGRFVFCVAVGNAEKDFEVTMTDWNRRGEMLDEDLKITQAIFNSNRKPISFQGKFLKFKDAEFSPAVSLPIWIAGKGRRALRRVAEYGTGWMPSGIAPDSLAETKVKLQKVMQDHGRRISDVDICIEIFVGIAKTKYDAKSKFEPTFRKFAGLSDIARLGSYSQVPIGSPSDILDWVLRYKSAGATHFEAKFYAPNLHDLLQSMELFSKEVIPFAQGNN
jgi:alkanesulfonate monooxygenase SsuD/methylene tetrahydromethanopterin reductase-like flavin-dependent oxidoreductase (luciferase family)